MQRKACHPKPHIVQVGEPSRCVDFSGLSYLDRAADKAWIYQLGIFHVMNLQLFEAIRYEAIRWMLNGGNNSEEGRGSSVNDREIRAVDVYINRADFDI